MVRDEEAAVIEILTIATPSLGDRSYLAHDGAVAVAVDPQRDLDRVEALAMRLGVRIALVAETHLHNDYVTGGLALAKRAGCPYLVAASEDLGFERTPVRDGERFDAGRMSLTALHTPGHTPHHLSYVLEEDGGEPLAVFTGGSMLYGSVGRTDLVDARRTEELTRAQYRSVRHLADELADPVAVWPTHGFGSFCSAITTVGDSSSIGNERRQNVALVIGDEDVFVERLIAGLGAYPRYYAHMGAANAAGPGAPDLDPPRAVDAGELLQRVEAGEWVVDLRDRASFARAHVSGTISVELGDAFATHLGWAVPWGTPVSVVGPDLEQVAAAQRELVRIGIDRLAGAAVGPIAAVAEGRLAGYPVRGFADLAAVEGGAGIVVLDVRRPEEWAEGHLAGAVHVPFWEIEARGAELPPGEVWVHCASGARASVAASLLARAGRQVVLVDDDWSNAGRQGLPVVGAS